MDGKINSLSPIENDQLYGKNLMITDNKGRDAMFKKGFEFPQDSNERARKVTWDQKDISKI